MQCLQRHHRPAPRQTREHTARKQERRVGSEAAQVVRQDQLGPAEEHTAAGTSGVCLPRSVSVPFSLVVVWRPALLDSASLLAFPRRAVPGALRLASSPHPSTSAAFLPSTQTVPAPCLSPYSLVLLMRHLSIVTRLPVHPPFAFHRPSSTGPFASPICLYLGVLAGWALSHRLATCHAPFSG